jgi:restriction endonuclease S subunit
MDGLEAVEIKLSDIDLGDRCDAEFFAKEYLRIQNRLAHCNTITLRNISKMVASAFYPAATDLYSIGDTPFIRCVDCIPYPVITKRQDETFERIPLQFALENNGISFLKRGDIVITKVGSPCYASIVDDYDMVALSRTVMGLTEIRNISPEYLMVFLRCKFGIEQLFRHRELTIQYQLTLDRVKKVNVFKPSTTFQAKIKEIVQTYNQTIGKAINIYNTAASLLLSTLGIDNFIPSTNPIAVKSFSESFGVSGRLDAEYYQRKYEDIEHNLNATHTVESLPCWVYDGFFIPRKGDYKYIELANIGAAGNITGCTIAPFDELPSRARRLVKRGQVIVSSIEGSLASCALITDDYDGAICSTGFYVVDSPVINSETLLMLFKSVPIQAMMKKRCSGTILTAISKTALEKMPFPMIDNNTQREIAVNVQNSFALRRQSEQLLDAAKRAVEIAIEDGEDAAMAWLEGCV